jgi:hypothetical protein
VVPAHPTSTSEASIINRVSVFMTGVPPTG